ncbi:MAG: hypothetical protein U0Q16_15740 [Bryobacteraceae bacterium]
MFQGTMSGSSIVFRAPFDEPGNNVRTLRLTNVRVNANRMGVAPGKVSYASVRVRMTGVGLDTSSRLVLAIAQNSLRPFSTGLTWSDPGASIPAQVGSVRFEELFPSVFRRRVGLASNGSLQNQDLLGAIYQTETGFFNSSLPVIAGRGDLGTAGLPDSSTRLMARFSGIPAGAQLYVQNRNIYAVLTSSDSVGRGPFTAVPADAAGFSPLAVLAGSAMAVWEVVNTDTTSIEAAEFAVYATYPPGTSRPPGQIVRDLAPGDATGTAMIPRFRIQGGTMSPSSCTFNIAPYGIIPIEATRFKVQVTTQQGCEWSAETQSQNQIWLASSGRVQGSGEVTMQASPNFGPPRTAVVRIADKNVPVTQSGGSSRLPAPFITAPAPSQVIPVRGVTFAWDPVPGATHYEVRYSRFYDETDFIAGVANATSLLADIPVSREICTYYLHVRACTGPPADAVCGSFAESFFTVGLPSKPLGTPAIISPVSNQAFTNSTVTFRWEADPNAETYLAKIREGGSDATVLQIRLPSSSTSTVYSIPEGTYWFSVQSCTSNPDDCWVGNTTRFLVQLPPVPTGVPVIAQATIGTANQLTASWSSVLGADIYRVQVVQPNTGPGGGALTVAAGQTAVNNIALPVPSGPATVLVAACNGNGCGPYSAGTPINPSAGNPAGPILGNPIPGTSVSTPVLFTWSRVPGDNGSNTTYRLYVGDLGRSTTAADIYTTNNFAAAQLNPSGVRYDALVVASPGPSQVLGPTVGFQVAGGAPLSPTGEATISPTMVAPGHGSRVRQGNVQIGWTRLDIRNQRYQYFVAVRGTSAPTVSGIAEGQFVFAPLPAVNGAPTEYSAIVRACQPDGYYEQDILCPPNGDTGWGPWSNAPGGAGVTNFTVAP